MAPELVEKVRKHDGKLPLMEAHHVVEQIHKALDRKVWLPSGGYLVIDKTEAMTVIDVNTGKHVGKQNLEETVTKTNLEAGTWYLGRALERWKDTDDPVPFALAEYNAGRSRLEKWAAKSAPAEEMLRLAGTTNTRQYVDDVIRRFRIYREHGW